MWLDLEKIPKVLSQKKYTGPQYNLSVPLNCNISE